MAEKTYKYNSVCERENPIQTNNGRQFMLHLASCPACRENTPHEIWEDLESEVTLIMAQRAKDQEEPADEAKKEEPTEAKKDGITRIRFKATSNKQLHGSRGINLKDGQTAEVPYDDAKHCMIHWPKNFEIIGGYWPKRTGKK